jgi:hypothetical protein
MTNVNDNVRISDNIGVVASSSSKQLSSIRTLSLPFFILNILPGDQEGLFKLALQLRKFFNSVIYNTATGYVLLVYLTNI